jgi:hypothetical protein
MGAFSFETAMWIGVSPYLFLDSRSASANSSGILGEKRGRGRGGEGGERGGERESE